MVRDQGEASPAATPTWSASSSEAMAWTAVTTPGTTTRATIEPTTANPRRSDTEEMKPVIPASIAATSTRSATALRRSVVWSLTSSPASNAPAYRTRRGSRVKTSSAVVSDAQRVSATTYAGSGRAR